MNDFADKILGGWGEMLWCQDKDIDGRAMCLVERIFTVLDQPAARNAIYLLSMEVAARRRDVRDGEVRHLVDWNDTPGREFSEIEELVRRTFSK